jgi:hypothetical protein
MPTRLAPGGRWPSARAAPTPRGRRPLGRATAWVPRVSAYRRLAVALTAAGRRPPCQAAGAAGASFAERGTPGEAGRLCAGCPVLDVCEKYAVAARKPLGARGWADGRAAPSAGRRGGVGVTRRRCPGGGRSWSWGRTGGRPAGGGELAASPGRTRSLSAGPLLSSAAACKDVLSALTSLSGAAERAEGHPTRTAQEVAQPALMAS